MLLKPMKIPCLYFCIVINRVCANSEQCLEIFLVNLLKSQREFGEFVLCVLSQAKKIFEATKYEQL